MRYDSLSCLMWVFVSLVDINDLSPSPETIPVHLLAFREPNLGSTDSTLIIGPLYPSDFVPSLVLELMCTLSGGERLARDEKGDPPYGSTWYFRRKRYIYSLNAHWIVKKIWRSVSPSCGWTKQIALGDEFRERGLRGEPLGALAVWSCSYVNDKPIDALHKPTTDLAHPKLICASSYMNSSYS